MSRWILRAAILFSCLALLTGAGLLLDIVDVARDGVPQVLATLTLAALALFAILLAIGTFKKWRHAAQRNPGGGKRIVDGGDCEG